MKRYSLSFIPVALLVASLLLSSCHSAYRVTKVEGTMIAMDSTWDNIPNAEAARLLAPYKAGIDSMMYRVLGTADVTLEKGFPESLLSNLVADVLRLSATQALGKPADVGVINMGGLRNILTKGPITCGNIYEVLPFENSLCVLTMKGSALKQLCGDMALKRGEGVSGMQLAISKDGKLLQATLAGQPIDNDRLYTVATIDYLADGNDGFPSLIQSEKRICPDGAVLRQLFMNYVEQQTAAGKPITARMEGRITIIP